MSTSINVHHVVTVWADEPHAITNHTDSGGNKVITYATTLVCEKSDGSTLELTMFSDGKPIRLTTL